MSEEIQAAGALEPAAETVEQKAAEVAKEDAAWPKFPLKSEVVRHGKRRVVIGHVIEQSELPVAEGAEPQRVDRWTYLLHNPDKGPFARLTAEAAEENELESVVEHASRLLGVQSK